MSARGRGVVVAIVACLALTGCMELPTTGPVTEADGATEEADVRAADIDARPPREGMSRTQVVVGFLDAMMAWPIQTSVAKDYLTTDAAEQWNPDAGTIVYGGSPPPEETSAGVRIELTTADRLDGSGGWRGPLTDDELGIDLRLVRQGGEWRIADPPDALMVPTAWFRQRFRQVSLHFVDPSATTLVPEPVYVPVGDQLATSLVTALLGGPPEGLGQVVRTMIPAGLSVGLSVPVSADGVARIDLVGDAPALPSEAIDLLYAQFAWTLRQDPAITAFRVTIEGEELAPSNGTTPYAVQGAGALDPAGADASPLIYALRDGQLLSGSFRDLEPVSGPFGTGENALESVAVAPDGDRAAAVVGQGRRVLQAPVDGDGETTTLLSDGVDLDRPTWDAAGRLWLLDRRPSGARILVVAGEGVRQIEVPGVTGRSVRQVAVSRDGTRLTAVIRRQGRDRVVTSRVVFTPQGEVREVLPGTVVRPADGPRILDLAWSGAVELTLLTPSPAGSLFEVATIPAGGGFLEATGGTELLRGEVVGLAAAPGRPVLAVRADELVDVLTQESEPLADGVVAVDYAG